MPLKRLSLLESVILPAPLLEPCQYPPASDAQPFNRRAVYEPLWSTSFQVSFHHLIHHSFTFGLVYYNSHKQSFNVNVDLNAGVFLSITTPTKRKGFLILDIYYLLGGVILLALGLLMPAFYYLPKAVLAAVVISSVMFLVEYEEIKPMWKSRSINLMNQWIHLFIVLWVMSVRVPRLSQWAAYPMFGEKCFSVVCLFCYCRCHSWWLFSIHVGIELLPLVLTFLSCLFVNMEFGIILGAGFHLLLLLHLGNKPKISVGEIQAINVIKTSTAESTMVSSFLDFSALKRKKTPINLEKGQPRVCQVKNAQVLNRGSFQGGNAWWRDRYPLFVSVGAWSCDEADPGPTTKICPRIGTPFFCYSTFSYEPINVRMFHENAKCQMTISKFY